MIPSVLAQQMRQGVADFLRTTFPIATPFFRDILDKLLDEDGGVFKEPYLSLQLPFLQRKGGADYFPEVPLEFPPYVHQELAFERLGNTNPKSTIVATGTGSGKTECFLWPILNYCYQNRDQDGIKAILIYPMNALATDQAARIAKAIWHNDKLKSRISAGLFVGDKGSGPGTSMTETQVLTNRETMRLKPPDILLTNYKMLDYLLVRPKDFPIWQHNGPETLRYLVVDELHTFDGAQGTDLAYLVRRLKARLKTPKHYLAAVGTSATLGGAEGQGEAKLLEFAGQVFHETFDDKAIIKEHRQRAGDFLEESEIIHMHAPAAEKAADIDPNNYPNYDAYVRAQLGLWFGDEWIGIYDSDPDWRLRLGEALKTQVLFQNLIKILAGRPWPYDELLNRLEKGSVELRGAAKSYREDLLSSLVALVSEARREVIDAAGHPRVVAFVDVRLQLWLRELRRMVVQVSREPRLRFADDLTQNQVESHLPVVHCRECNSMGWGATRRRGQAKVHSDLRQFYSSFFSRSQDLVFLFPERTAALADGIDGAPAKFCLSCLHLNGDTSVERCNECDAEDLLEVFVPDTRKRRGDSFHSTPD